MAIRFFTIQPVAAVPVQSLNNGLSLNGTAGQLGGTLLQNTVVDLNGNHSLQFVGGNGAQNVAVSLQPNGTSGFGRSDSANNSGQLSVSNGTASLVATNFFASTAGVFSVGIGNAAMNAVSPGNTYTRFIVNYQSGQSFFSDATNFEGFGYFADYSVNGLSVYGNRFVPDIGLVNNNISNAISGLPIPNVSANNGLTDVVTGNNHVIGLGGALTSSITRVTIGAGQTLQFADTAIQTVFQLTPGQLSLVGSNTTAFSQLVLSSSAAVLLFSSPGGLVSSIRQQGSGMTITDGINSMGLVYTADYSALSLTNNRAILDFGAIKSYIASLGQPVLRARAHSVGLTVGTYVLYTYPVPASTSVQFRINNSYTQRNVGAGTVTIQIIWTDTGGTVNTKTPQTKNAAGGDFVNVGSILAAPGTNITVSAIITGTAIGDVSSTMEELY